MNLTEEILSRLEDHKRRISHLEHLESAGATLFDRAIVINESGADVDTRIEAVGQANALFVQGSDGNIGFGTGAPDRKVVIAKDASLYLKIHATTGTSQIAGIILQRGNFQTDDLADWSIENDGGNLKFHSYYSGATVANILHLNATGRVGMGLIPTINMLGLSIEAGLLTLKERATPTADANYGKIYCKADHYLYYQTGTGVEYAIDMTPGEEP